MQPEGGLDRSKIAAFDCEPRGGATDKACGMCWSERYAADSLIVPAREMNARRATTRTARQENDHGDAAAQSEAEHQHEQDRHYVRCDIHSALNLRTSGIHSNRKCMG